LKQSSGLALAQGKQGEVIFYWQQWVAAYLVKIKRLINVTLMAILFLAAQLESQFV